MTRSRDDRFVAGVAGGLGRHLGVDPTLVRTGFVVLAFAGGVGVVAYLALWLVAPLDTSATRPRPSRPTLQQAAALALITLGVLLLLRRLGLWFGDALVWPVVLGAAGSAIVWTRGDDGPDAAAVGRAAPVDGLAARPGAVGAVARAALGPMSAPRVLFGTVLVGVAIAAFLNGVDALVALRDLTLAVLAAAAGVTLLFGPWFARLAEELGRERRERVRQEERADLAAHLHDSVLQTLALIQRSSDDPRRIATLARVQERELRAWLYGRSRGSADAPTTLTDAVEQVAAEVEALHHLAVDVVVVGDAVVDDAVRAMLGAVREAATNAAKHAEVDEVAVYVEVDDDLDAVLAFVRDRGVGFDPDVALTDDADDHRRGLRDSVVRRVERHGGQARLWSSPGAGTEIELTVPRRPPTTSDVAEATTPTQERSP